jgi:hypothetical protein
LSIPHEELLTRKRTVTKRNKRGIQTERPIATSLDFLVIHSYRAASNKSTGFAVALNLDAGVTRLAARRLPKGTGAMHLTKGI